MSDPRRGAPWVVLCTLVLGCRSPGLPPEPPERDAARAEAEIPAYVPSKNPLSTSAFDGVPLNGGGGHAHHHHGGKATKPEAPSEPAEGEAVQ